MDPNPKKPNISTPESAISNGSTYSSFANEVLAKFLSLIDSHKDRNSVSVVCKNWYNAERWTRTNLFIGNCYFVSPEIVARRFPRIKSVRLKGKSRLSDFNMLPRDWEADLNPWLVMFAKVYHFLEELRLKRMTVRMRASSSWPSHFRGSRLYLCQVAMDSAMMASMQLPLIACRYSQYIRIYWEIWQKSRDSFCSFCWQQDWEMQCVLEGCPKLRKLEIRDCQFSNDALLSGLEKYERMRSLWMSACCLTMKGCMLLARKMPRLNVEVIKDEESDDSQAEKVYVYRSIAGARQEVPPFVLTL